MEFTLATDFGNTQRELPGKVKLLSQRGRPLLGSSVVSVPAERVGFYEHRLINGTLYSLDHASKCGAAWILSTTELSALMQRYWLPLMICLEPEPFAKWVDAHIEKQDAWYTYVHLRAKSGGRKVLRYDRARVAVLNRATDAFPLNTPIQMHFWDGGCQRIDVRVWRRNDPNRVRESDFEIPDPLYWDLVPTPPR